MKDKSDYQMREIIKEVIYRRRATQAGVARKAGLNVTTFYRYLAGRLDMRGAKVDAVREALGLLVVDPIDEE